MVLEISVFQEKLIPILLDIVRMSVQTILIVVLVVQIHAHFDLLGACICAIQVQIIAC